MSLPALHILLCLFHRTTTTGASEPSSQSWLWPVRWRGGTLAELRTRCWCELWETSTSRRSWPMTCPCSWGWLETCFPLWMSPGKETWTLRSMWRSPFWIWSYRRRTILYSRYGKCDFLGSLPTRSSAALYWIVFWLHLKKFKCHKPKMKAITITSCLWSPHMGVSSLTI